HTRFARDWSSDVCSSDLIVLAIFSLVVGTPRQAVLPDCVEGPFQKEAQLALEAGPRDKGLSAVGMLDDRIVDSTDLDHVLARTDVQARKKLDPAGDPRETQHPKLCHGHPLPFFS